MRTGTRLKVGDEVFWYGSGSQRKNMFKGTIIQLGYADSKQAVINAKPGQGLIIDRSIVGYKNLKKIK